MTEQKSFKRLVRARMEKTGESYTTGAHQAASRRGPGGVRGREVGDLRRDDSPADRPRVGGVVRAARRVGRPEPDPSRDRPLARRAAGPPPAGVERPGGRRQLRACPRTARRRREGRRLRGHGVADGGGAGRASVRGVRVRRSAGASWLPDGRLRERTATRPKSARFDWGDGDTRVNVTFLPKGEARSTAALEHRRLADASEAERMKTYWRERLAGAEAHLGRR